MLKISSRLGMDFADMVIDNGYWRYDGKVWVWAHELRLLAWRLWLIPSSSLWNGAARVWNWSIKLVANLDGLSFFGSPRMQLADRSQICMFGRANLILSYMYNLSSYLSSTILGEYARYTAETGIGVAQPSSSMHTALALQWWRLWIFFSFSILEGLRSVAWLTESTT